MRIEVTQEHIDRGVSSVTACPLALALLDMGATDVRVGGLISIGGKDHRETYDHTIASRKFIDAFDSGKKVKPHTFIFREW